MACTAERVCALRPSQSQTIIKYVGERITWKGRCATRTTGAPNHAFFFHIDDQHVIDAAVNGNAARWINHACKAQLQGRGEGTARVDAARDIAPGELFYDYGLVIDERYASIKKQFECRCGRRSAAAPCFAQALSPHPRATTPT